MIDYENLAKLNAPFMDEIESRARTIMRGGWFILGPEVETFEKAFAAYCQTSECVGVASGLDALLLALKVLDLPAGSEVIVPSNTYIATIMAILQAGHKPVLVEPDLRTYNIDPARVAAAITSKTRAIMIVHLYGKACDMDPLMALSRKYDLFIVEDCAQAHGALYKGRSVGTFGLGAFSFYPTKNLGAFGDAGAVTCADALTAMRLRRLRNYGSRVKYQNEVVGYNSRLDELQAGILSVKLMHLNEINTHKRQLADLYFETLTDEVVKPARDPDFFDVYHIFNIRCSRRDALREHLLNRGIKTEIHYPIPPAEQEALKGLYLAKDYPLAAEIHQTTLSLPISYCHSEADVRTVAAAINEFFS